VIEQIYHVVKHDDFAQTYFASIDDAVDKAAFLRARVAVAKASAVVERSW